MWRRTFTLVVSVILCIVAALISYELLAKHITGTSGPGWFEAGCTADDESGGANCAAVLAGPHAYWPPKRPGEAAGTPHIPVAFLGLIYFATLAVWLIGVGSPSPARRWFHLIPLLWVAAGLCISLCYTYIMFTVLEEWCPWCLLTHILNLLIAVCIALLWPRVPRTLATSAGSSPIREQGGPELTDSRETAREVRSRHDPRHPSWTRVLGTIGVILMVNYGNYGQAGLLAVRKTNATLQRCLMAITRIKADTAKLVTNWQLATPREITVRPDDPVRATDVPDGRTLKLVVFTDFLCPSCKSFASVLDEKIRPLFGGRLEVVFKHFPMDRECNAHTSRTLHPNACAAAQIAEAARLQGGNGAFWQTHDLLFSRQGQESAGGISDVNAIATALKLDASRLGEDMRSAGVTQRVKEDTSLGQACGVHSTPAVFVEGKRVNILAIMEIGFWDAVAERFWKRIGEPRPQSTRPGRAASTPGSPDRKDDP